MSPTLDDRAALGSRSPFDQGDRALRNRSIPIATLVAALLSLGLIAGCGGDDGPDGDDPQAVLDEAFNSEEQVSSGILDLQFDLSSDGEQGGTVTASLQGPFQSGEGEASLPQLDLTAAAQVDAATEQFDFEGGLIVTEDAGYVTFEDTAYEVDPATFTLLQDSYEQSAQLAEEESEGSTSLDQFGVDPSTWVTDVTSEGTEDLDGTEVNHVSGSADVGAIVVDLQSIAEQSGQAEQLDPAALEQVENSVQSATIDVFAGAEDGILRRLELNLELTDPTGAAGAVTIAFSAGVSDPNEEQEIAAPEDAQPFSDLLERIPGGAEALGGLGGAGASGLDPGPAADSGAPPAASIGQDYIDCVTEAATPTDAEVCNELLEG